MSNKKEITQELEAAATSIRNGAGWGNLIDLLERARRKLLEKAEEDRDRKIENTKSAFEHYQVFDRRLKEVVDATIRAGTPGIDHVRVLGWQLYRGLERTTAQVRVDVQVSKEDDADGEVTVYEVRQSMFFDHDIFWSDAWKEKARVIGEEYALTQLKNEVRKAEEASNRGFASFEKYDKQAKTLKTKLAEELARAAKAKEGK